MRLASWLRRLAGPALFAASCTAALAQDYPSRPLTVVLPVTAGSSIDVVMRTVTADLAKRLGQTIVVDNKPGAGGNIGAAVVAKAAPDGHTLLATTSNLAMVPALMKSLPFDPRGSFVPVAGLFSGAMSVAVGAHVPARTLDELITLARQSPGKLSYATPGYGTPHHFGTGLLTQSSGIDLLHVPFRGTGPAMMDLVGGRVDVAYFSLGNLLEQHRAGKLRILATSTDARLSQLPDVPTLRELGRRDAEINVWAGLFAPAGTPAAIVARLEREMLEVMRSAPIRAALAAQNVVAIEPGTAAQLGSFYQSDLDRWPGVAARLGLKVE